MHIPRVEKQFQGYALGIISDILRKHPEWDNPSATQEAGRTDVLIKVLREDLLVIELKDPIDFASPLNEDLRKQAEDYSHNRGTRYFLTWNIKEWVLWDRYCALDKSVILKENVLSDDDINYYRNHNQLPIDVRKALFKKIHKLVNILVDLLRDKKLEYELDKQFITNIEALINSYLDQIAHDLFKYYNKNKIFREQMIAYVLNEHQWSWEEKKSQQYKEIERLTRLSLLLIITKVIFYHSLFTKKEGIDLPRFIMPKNADDPKDILKYLWNDYFNVVINRIDFEELLGEKPTFLDEMPFYSKHILHFLSELVDNINHYNFQQIPTDIIGKIFERLIDEDRRHKLGQYFTRSDVADLICAFTIRSGNEVLLDAGSGSGTFSVRAYERMKKLKTIETHTERLNKIYAVEIAKYPAHLTMLNLILRDLRFERNYPRVINDDFFKLGLDFQVDIRQEDGLRKRMLFKPVDVVIGNPPYTRSEEMEDIYRGIKNFAADQVKREWHILPDKRSSIYSYFIYHGLSLLKQGGRLGYIVSNTWLDVGFGAGLQELLLNNSRIIAIIGSDESWFDEPKVNTIILIAERCSSQEERNKNLVKFVFLKKPLIELWHEITTVQLSERIEYIDKPGFFNSEFFRCTVVQQKELLQEAIHNNVFIGSKWGKYLKSYPVFARLFSKLPSLFTSLSNISEDIIRGFTTGADPFFYVKDISNEMLPNEIENMFHITINEFKDKKLCIIKSGDNTIHLIESKYLKPIFKDPKSSFKPFIEEYELEYKVVYICEEKSSLKGTWAEKYLEYGETTRFPMGKGRYMIPAQTITCRSRKIWYKQCDLQPARLFFQKAYYDRYRHFIINSPVLCNQRLYAIYPSNPSDIEIIAALLNSFITLAYSETQRVHMAEGAVEATVKDCKNFPIIDPQKIDPLIKKRIVFLFKKLSKRDTLDIDEEIKQQDRITYDLAVLYAMGFNKTKEREHILNELYNNLLQLTSSRIGKRNIRK